MLYILKQLVNTHFTINKSIIFTVKDIYLWMYCFIIYDAKSSEYKKNNRKYKLYEYILLILY